jgi:hypothetical protein
VFKGANKENVVKMEQMVADLISGEKSSAATTSAPQQLTETGTDKKL